MSYALDPEKNPTQCSQPGIGHKSLPIVEAGPRLVWPSRLQRFKVKPDSLFEGIAYLSRLKYVDRGANEIILF
jgi:hypothetical protein